MELYKVRCNSNIIKTLLSSSSLVPKLRERNPYETERRGTYTVTEKGMQPNVMFLDSVSFTNQCSDNMVNVIHMGTKQCPNCVVILFQMQ